MVRTIIFALLGFLIVSLAILWILSGGPREVITSADDAFDFAFWRNPISTELKLPWQPSTLFSTIDIAPAWDESQTGLSGTLAAEQELALLEAEYERLVRESDEVKTFGTPSPYRGQIALVDNSGNMQDADPASEFITIGAAYGNNAPVDITGWSIESALTGIKVYIPSAAAPYMTGSMQNASRVVLDPGAIAILATAPSPVGVSFRENICTGYLAQFQQFSPPLADDCPAPSQVLPFTSDNLVRYGESCFDALASIPNCSFPQTLPTHITPACQSKLSTSLSYNGCVADNSFRTSFHKNIWRLYLGSPSEIWRNSHDALRLLDAEGRSVNVLVY